MDVVFKRTGERRYAVVVKVEGREPQWMNPAPGYDDDIPHDLVHYVVEAELGLETGVYGRAVLGGGTFIGVPEEGVSSRERARARRKQQKRDARMGSLSAGSHDDMLTSERLSGLSDLAFRRKQGQRPDPALWKPEEALAPEDAARVARVVARLDTVAALWRALPVGGELRFAWPSLCPEVARTP